MWERIKTALVLVTIVGVAMFAFDSAYPFIALLIIGGVLSWREWEKIVPKLSTTHAVFVHGLAGFVLAISLLLPVTWPFWWIVSVFIWLMAISWIFDFPETVDWYNKSLHLLGTIIFTASLTSMYYLWMQSPWWLLYVFCLVWAADSGAYFTGKKFGKRKMAPKVSPNKSMEGLYGGLALGILMVLLVSFIELKYTGLQLLYFVVLSGLTIVASVFGDLFESMLKRQAGVKDSGTLLPGHGGILDRIDSLLSATPIFALGFWFMQTFVV